MNEHGTKILIEVEDDFKLLGQKLSLLTRNDLENVKYDMHDPDECFKYDEYLRLINKLYDIQSDIEYLNKPVSNQGALSKNTEGRYAFPNGEYLTSGNSVELLLEDDFRSNEWVSTCIEHNGDDYYAVSLGKDVSLKGIMGRIRR